MTGWPPPSPGSRRPTRKVTRAVLVGMIWTLAMAVLGRIGIDPGAEVVAAGGTLVSGLAAYQAQDGP